MRVTTFTCLRVWFALGTAGCASASPTAHPTVLATPIAPEPSAAAATVSNQAPVVASSGPSAPSASSSPPPPLVVREQFEGLDVDEIVEAMATRPVAAVIGRYRSTSVVYRLRLEGGLEVGFKPAIPGQLGWWRHEVMAFHLARLLGLSAHVPPAVSRRVALRTLGPDAVADRVVTARDDPRQVPGAMVLWIPVLRATHLAWPARRSRWESWLDPSRSHDAIDDDLARDISSVLLFDYLQANDDRWNDANIVADGEGTLLFRDNNVGWFVGGLRNLTWNQGMLRRVRRFPLSLVDSIDHAGVDALRAEVARERNTADSLLDENGYAAYAARRDYLLAYIRSVRARYGDDAVLAWP